MQKFETTHGNKAEVPKFKYNHLDKNIGTTLLIQNLKFCFIELIVGSIISSIVSFIEAIKKNFKLFYKS
jgi:hypothetical protein